MKITAETTVTVPAVSYQKVAKTGVHTYNVNVCEYVAQPYSVDVQVVKYEPKTVKQMVDVTTWPRRLSGGNPRDSGCRMPCDDRRGAGESWGGGSGRDDLSSGPRK